MSAPGSAIEHTTLEPTKLDQRKLESFIMRAIGDLSAGYGGVMVSRRTQPRVHP